MKNYLFIAVAIGFLFIGFNAYQEGRPTKKDAQIYKKIKEYSPYYIDQRFGGFNIKSKKDENFKEQPQNVEVFRRMDELEQKWGNRYLKISDSKVIIMDDNNKTIVQIPIASKEDRDFIHSFYGL